MNKKPSNFQYKKKISKTEALRAKQLVERILDVLALDEQKPRVEIEQIQSNRYMMRLNDSYDLHKLKTKIAYRFATHSPEMTKNTEELIDKMGMQIHDLSSPDDRGHGQYWADIEILDYNKIPIDLSDDTRVPQLIMDYLKRLVVD